MKKHFLLILLCILFSSADIYAQYESTYPGVKKVKEDLYFDETEVTNFNWLEYLYWLGKNHGTDSEEFISALPDTNVWARDPAHWHDISIQYYLRHPAYRTYPVVGITYDQAVRFCKWRTDRVKEFLAMKKLKAPDFEYRLPYEFEWEIAAAAGHDTSDYPKSLELKRIGVNAPFQVFIDSWDPSVVSFIVPVDGMSGINSFHLKGMLGNVQEMVQEKGISKGGSYKDSAKHVRISKRHYYSRTENYIGFRCALEINPIREHEKTNAMRHGFRHSVVSASAYRHNGPNSYEIYWNDPFGIDYAQTKTLFRFVGDKYVVRKYLENNNVQYYSDSTIYASPGTPLINYLLLYPPPKNKLPDLSGKSNPKKVKPFTIKQIYFDEKNRQCVLWEYSLTYNGGSQVKLDSITYDGNYSIIKQSWWPEFDTNDAKTTYDYYLNESFENKIFTYAKLDYEQKVLKIGKGKSDSLELIWVREFYPNGQMKQVKSYSFARGADTLNPDSDGKWFKKDSTTCYYNTKGLICAISNSRNNGYYNKYYLINFDYKYDKEGNWTEVKCHNIYQKKVYYTIRRDIVYAKK
jgi:formylglycine-generating enzyme required for sulfatase activity